MNVDRQNRDKLSDAIRRYLADEITAFEFDDEIFQISDDTADPTIHYVVQALWCLYDDCQDHQVVLSKEEWDYCQRLILLLKADAHIEIEKRRRWSLIQVTAGAALLAFVACSVRLGIGNHLFAIAIPFGFLSMGLSALRSRSRRHVSTEELAMVPFSSVSEIIAVWRQVPGFSKNRYPVDLAGRRIRSASEESFHELHRFAAWLKMSPLVLFVQMLPETETRTRVVSA